MDSKWEIKVSVIIPVFNAEKYLYQCLNSVTSQSLKKIEIICVNDGSVDKSLDILKEFAEKDPRVRVVSKQNAGAGAARNTGIDLARGKYLSFLDADDFFEPQMLEKAYKAAEAGRADITVFHSDQFREDLNKRIKVGWVIKDKEIPPYRPMNYRTFTANVFMVFVGWAWDKLFRRDFIMKNDLRFQELRTSNDMLFVFSSIVLAKRIEVIDDVLVHQRRNNSNSLSNTREKSWDCFYKALCALRDNLRRFGLYEELEQDFINYALHFSLWNYNTISGSMKEVLRNKLVNEWFSDLQIKGKPEQYFYYNNEYRQYLKMIQ